MQKTNAMKKYLLLICISLLSFAGIKAQGWSATLRTNDGLPGEANEYYGSMYYTFKSNEFTPGGTLDIIRLTVVETVSNEKPNGNNTTFALSELKIYDGNGNTVPYTAYSNADQNLMGYKEDGGGIEALSDNNIKSYFHSLWHGINYGITPVTEYHYIELSLSRSVSTFSIEWSTRIDESKNAPTVVGITLGSNYNPGEIASDFKLGSTVTTDEELANGSFFVLKGNAQKSFTTSDGFTYSGSGPIFHKSAEAGSTEATQEHIMQLIPFGDGRYFIYWPLAGKYLKDSYEAYNGANGWQYSTAQFSEAALTSIKSTGNGYFEIEYGSTYNNQPITFYVGAELRDNVNSKMKTFDLEHKQYLESGDYSKGFSLPIAFNWSIYKAEIGESTASSIALKIKDVAEAIISSTIEEASALLATHGNFNGLCSNGEDTALENGIKEANQLLQAGTATLKEVTNKKEELLKSVSIYYAVKLEYYSNRIKEIIANASYSSSPNYIEGTYPEDSKSILESIQSTIANAKSMAGTYNAEQYSAIYNKIEQDIELFESTKIKETTSPEEDGEEEETEEDAIFVYLSNGDIDAYELSCMEGSHYTQNGKLYIPIKGGETYYYTDEEYDSCTATRPQLPTMTSFKFNNKYNPNLHVDAIAEPVSKNMKFALNAIGKWLTASFTLSDDRAVAYVDTVPQISKETRQSFKDAVTYRVTYPGYNIIKKVKVQDEIWSNPSAGETVTDVPLTADNLATNKPSTQPNESLANLLDGNSNTIFHSTWGSANNSMVNVNAYITIDLPEALDKIQVYYKCRPATDYNPLIWEIYASNNGTSWTLVRTLDYITDDMPRGGSGQEYTSPTIDLGGSYSKLKIVQTYGEYSKNHLVLSELRIKKVTENNSSEPEKIQDAVYEMKRIPYGNEYKVSINWLTDAQNSVPRIDIDIDGGEFVTSKKYYLKAKFRIFGYGIYENFEDSVEIKGRGNSSWSQSKKPYRLKFAEKVKPFGLTKGKSWVLLANAQSGSLMANAISMKIGQMAGAEYTNHIVPVELYMNGQYMGSYMFTEKIGMANNSVDVSEDIGYLLELDTNSDDEFQFTTKNYNLPVFIKEPDLNDYSGTDGEQRKTNIISQMNSFSYELIRGNDVSHLVDMDALARYMLANELSLNQELGHPKSVFLFKENENDTNAKFKFGPIWDFDWGYGYENGHTYCAYGTTSSVLNSNMYGEPGYNFFYDLLNQEKFKKHYYKVWIDFVKNNSMEELIDYIDSYYTFAKSSFDNNQYEWGYSNGFTENDKERHKNWLQERKDYIYNNLEEYEIDDLIYTITGDVNCNNQLTIHDAALITAYLNNNTHSSFSNVKADCDKNGVIEIADARTVATLVKDGDAPTATYWYSTPQAIGEFYSNDYVMEMGDMLETELKLLSYDEEQYKAIQFDITIPQNIELLDIASSSSIAGHNFSCTDKGDNRYRVTAYSDEDKRFTTGDDNILSLFINATGIINEENRNIKISNIYAVDNENNELRLQDHAIRFNQSTGIGYNGKTTLVEGGDCITVTMLKADKITVYSVDGRKVKEVDAKEGTTRIILPTGIYIVNGEKVLVK